MEKYYEYDLKRDTLLGREVLMVFPNEGRKKGKWILKTEYFDAFPATELELVKRGYHIVHIRNKTRWNLPEDTEARAELAKFMHKKYALRKKCVIVGMSCGGMQGIYFAAKYPQYVSCMYLDAPVVNLLSCPAGLCGAKGDMLEEFERDRGMGMADLIRYRNHPLDNIPALVKHNIPIVLVSGDADLTVPYEHNGKLLRDAYEKNGCTIKTIIKKGGHHPHGLENNREIVNFILNNDESLYHGFPNLSRLFLHFFSRNK